jgi:hypothetical protein
MRSLRGGGAAAEADAFVVVARVVRGRDVVASVAAVCDLVAA